MPHPSLGSLDHRPWPVPARPWTWRQTWHDLRILHWPIPATSLRPLVPRSLEIQEFSGTAWVSVTPFWMSGVTRRPWPALPAVSRFPELNVRTYVRLGERPGVWFLSLDAGSRVAVWMARRLYHLPYVYARMQVRHGGDRVTYQSARPAGPAFDATYEPASAPDPAPPGTLAHWLTERYCLYSRSPSGQLYRADIHHAPWPLQPAVVAVRRNDMLRTHGLSVQTPAPQQHFARRLEVVVWSLERVPVIPVPA